MLEKIKTVLQISALPVVFASMCCLSPVILVLLGISTASFAGSLASTLYGTYHWAFRGFGLLCLVASLVFYFRRQNVCTFDDVVRRRNEIINMLALTLIAGVLGYLFFLYVVVEYAGKWLGVWG
jgi:hypothetical protein